MWIPASDRGLDVVHPDTNQRSSVVTARRKTRLVVRRGRTGIRSPVGEEGSGLDRLKRSCGGAKRDNVPVPVRSGRCSPRWRMSLIRWRYWSSSCGCLADVDHAGFDGVSLGGDVVSPLGVDVCKILAFSFRKFTEVPGGESISLSMADGAIFDCRGLDISMS